MSEATRPLPPRSDGDEPVHPRPPSPQPPEKRRSELPARLLTAAVLIPTVVYAIYAGGLVYLATVVAIILLGQREIYGLIEHKGAHPLVGFGLAAGAALPVVMFLGTEYHATILMTMTLLTVMLLQLGKAQITEALASMSGTFFGIFYVGWLLGHAVVLRNFDSAVSSRFGPAAAAEMNLVPQTGAYFMVFALTAVILCDAGAYFAGRAYGKRKLAPKISPGKTIEGAIGGVLVGVLGGASAKAVFDLFWPELSASFGWVAAGIFAAAVALAGLVGDLVESLLKRDADRKDAGALLPGMGGVMDRIDSALLGIPVMYYLLLLYTWVRVGGP